MRRAAFFVLVFVAGVAVGFLLSDRRDTRAAAPAEFKRPITIRRGDDPVLYLVPYAVAIDGKSDRLADRPDAPLWIIWLDGARVQLSYAEQPFPR